MEIASPEPTTETLTSPFSPHPRPRSLYSLIKDTKDAAMKCQFCLECFDLLDVFNHTGGVSTFASVSVTNEGGKSVSADKPVVRNWASLGRTYVVKDNTNPQFHEKDFEITDVISDGGMIVIQIFSLHPANKMPICIGSTIVPIKELLHSETVVKKLRVGSQEKGTVVIFMKNRKENKYQYMDDIVEYCAASDIAPTQEPSTMQSEEEDLKNTYFKDILGNIDRQRYLFKIRPQNSLRVCEEMFELSTSFNIPALFIRLLCEREHANMTVLRDMVQGFSEEISSITAVSRTSKMARYRQELSELGQSSRFPFKKSEWKGHPECKWAPVNLHAQVLEVSTSQPQTGDHGTDQGADTRHQYCLTAVGAMSAHWDKFKYGGLASLLGHNKDGDKFVKRRDLYKILAKVESLLEICGNTISTVQFPKIISDLKALSDMDLVRSAMEDLQRTLDSNKQLEIMTLSADIEKILPRNGDIMSSLDPDMVTPLFSAYCLHTQRAIVWSIAQLELDNREHFLSLLARYDACFSQMLSAVISSFILHLCFRSRDAVFQQQLSDLLVPILWESLLSTHGDETGMLEDMMFVIQHIGDITAQVKGSADASQVFVSRVTGTPANVRVVVTVPDEYLHTLPESVRLGGDVHFTCLFFSHGINEQQTIAYKISETGLQDRICEQFLSDLQSYIDQHVTPHSDLYSSLAQDGNDLILSASMEKLHTLFKLTKRAKCSDFIVHAEQIGRDIGCMRFTSCKSAKDRTSMSLTYEYCAILCQDFGVTSADLPPLLEQFRRDGTRYHNTFKNIGSYKYCFNKLQCKMLPAIYKPPPGTFGEGALQT